MFQGYFLLANVSKKRAYSRVMVVFVAFVSLLLIGIPNFSVNNQEELIASLEDQAGIFLNFQNSYHIIKLQEPPIGFEYQVSYINPDSLLDYQDFQLLLENLKNNPAKYNGHEELTNNHKRIKIFEDLIYFDNQEFYLAVQEDGKLIFLSKNADGQPQLNNETNRIIASLDSFYFQFPEEINKLDERPLLSFKHKIDPIKNIIELERLDALAHIDQVILKIVLRDLNSGEEKIYSSHLIDTRHVANVSIAKSSEDSQVTFY